MEVQDPSSPIQSSLLANTGLLGKSKKQASLQSYLIQSLPQICKELLLIEVFVLHCSAVWGHKREMQKKNLLSDDTLL